MTSALPRTGRILSIDWGEKRIGVALSDPDQMVCHPLTTLTRRSGKRFPLGRLRPYLDENSVVGIVLGLPLSPDGTDTDATAEVRELAVWIHDKTDLPVALLDERMTTARALRTVRELGGSTRGQKEKIDSLSATVLLQNFLESRRP